MKTAQTSPEEISEYGVHEQKGECHRNSGQHQKNKAAK
jgi:hypothetical protein